MLVQSIINHTCLVDVELELDVTDVWVTMTLGYQMHFVEAQQLLVYYGPQQLTLSPFFQYSKTHTNGLLLIN